MSFFVVDGEPRPKVYTELRVARKACTSPLWSVKSFHTLAEAAAAREQCRERGAREGERKRARTTTPVLTPQQVEQLVEEPDDPEEQAKAERSFGSWLTAQHYGDRSAYYDPQQAREEEEAKRWFAEHQARKERKRMQREAAEEAMEEARRRGEWPPLRREQPEQQQQKQQQRQRPPKFELPHQRVDEVAAALNVLEIRVPVTQVTEEMLKAAKKRLALLHHPDKNPTDKDRHTVLFRNVMQSFSLLANRLFGRPLKP